MLYALDDLFPDLAADSFVAPTAAVIGRVRLGAASSVWFGAVLRGDAEPIAVGAGCNVQDNAVLHTDPGFPLVLEDDVTVGHAAIVHGCHVGAGSLLGMGAVVMNGARIGRSCLIAAHALVTEGKQIPDFSIVRGSPGRIVGAITEEHRALLVATAAAYRARAARYASGLRPL